jgi:hypothetical protein
VERCDGLGEGPYLLAALAQSRRCADGLLCCALVVSSACAHAGTAAVRQVSIKGQTGEEVTRANDHSPLEVCACRRKVYVNRRCVGAHKAKRGCGAIHQARYSLWSNPAMRQPRLFDVCEFAYVRKVCPIGWNFNYDKRLVGRFSGDCEQQTRTRRGWRRRDRVVAEPQCVSSRPRAGANRSARVTCSSSPAL